MIDRIRVLTENKLAMTLLGIVVGLVGFGTMFVFATPEHLPEFIVGFGIFSVGFFGIALPSYLKIPPMDS